MAKKELKQLQEESAQLGAQEHQELVYNRWEDEDSWTVSDPESDLPNP